MGAPIKILIVEDEMIIAAKISLQLSNLGYDVSGMVPKGEDAIAHIKESMPDIILLDIQLKGQLDGIETAEKILLHSNIPIIYLTANADEATFNRAKTTKPAAFISKPFKQLDLQRAIELSISRMANLDNRVAENNADHESPFFLSDRIFVRHKEKMIKIMIIDILYIEADRNYSRIYTHQKEYLLSVTLKTIEEKLSMKNFLRIHRSYLINIMHVDEVIESHVMINSKPIPLGPGMREQLLQRIQTL